MGEKVKELINSLGLINSGVVGLTFFVIQLYSAIKNSTDFSGTGLVFSALGFAFFGGSLIWGLIRIRGREVHFKTDDKTKKLTYFEVLLNVIAVSAIAIGLFLAYYNETQAGIIASSPASAFRPYFFQGVAIFFAGVIIQVLTFYLYKRFIPKQVELGIGNTQAILSH